MGVDCLPSTTKTFGIKEVTMNINNYAAKCGMLQAEVGNIKQWVWPMSDNQTFGIIVNDWFAHIRPYLLEHFKNQKAGSVIQAGGNCGVYPLLYTELFDLVYTFEPDPLSFFCLVNNCQLDNITKFNAALGDQNGLIAMKEVQSNNRGMNKIEGTNQSGCYTPIVTIDSFEFKDVSLIQLDLEGYEVQAIKGATNTIQTYKPVIILECGDQNNPSDLKHRNEVFEMMKSIGYHNHKQLGRLDNVFLPDEL